MGPSQFRLELGKPVGGCRQLVVELLQLPLLFERRRFDDRWRVAHSPGLSRFGQIVEIRKQLVILLLCQGIVPVIVAPRATSCQPQEHGRSRVTSIHDVLDGVLFWNDAAF